jgi:hypothetical protein
MKLEPTIRDDGKGNHQSVSATAEYQFQTSNGSQVFIQVTGYGKDEFEARRNFVQERGTLRYDVENAFGMMGEDCTASVAKTM